MIAAGTNSAGVGASESPCPGWGESEPGRCRLEVEHQHRYVEVNGTRLHVVLAGTGEHGTLLLLHGFPEFWYGWRKQIPYLVSRGFRVIVPDQRGYNLSSKPKGVQAYQLDVLASDVIELAAALGAAGCGLVGHDWGAMVAWWAAILRPDVFPRLVVLNVPHPYVMARYVRTSLKQLARSWYILFFQLPLVPELFLRSRQYAPLVRAMTGSALPGTFTEDELHSYRTAWGNGEALGCMLNWYRSAFRTQSLKKWNRRVEVPTQVLWGVRDRFLGREMIEPSLSLCSEGDALCFPEATHWLHLERAQEVNQRIESFALRGRA